MHLSPLLPNPPSRSSLRLRKRAQQLPLPNSRRANLIRERNPADFIKTKGEKAKGPKSTQSRIGRRIAGAVREKVKEHQDKQEAPNEYAVGVTEEVAAEVAIEARSVPENAAHTVQRLMPKTKEQVLSRPEPEPEEPRELGDPGYSQEQQQRNAAVEQAKEKTQRTEHTAPAPDAYDQHTPVNEPPYQEPAYSYQFNQVSAAEPARPSGGQSGSGGKPDIREKPKGNTAPKQKPSNEPKTKAKTEKAAPKIKPARQAAVQNSAAKKATEQGRKKFKREAQKKMAEKTKQAARKAAEWSKKAAVATVRVVKSVFMFLVGIFGGVGAVVVFAIAILVGAILASPLGIFFSNESTSNSVPLSSAVSQINMELNTRLISLQSGEFTEIIIEGAPPDWADVIAVFASYTAGSDIGVDVVSLTPDRVSRLRTVFWNMCFITSSTESEEIPDSDPEDDIDDSHTETTLTITITAKTADDMRSVYGFSDYQNQALDTLLANPAALNSLLGNLSVSQQDALELLRSLPADLSPERRAVVQQALTLVGKVNYFWGGKSLVLGWDSRWGLLREVTSAGSPTTGTYRPYGLDCSGFVDWVFYNVSGGEYIIGHGGGAAAQHSYCTQIGWGEAQPGDLVFYPDDSHVGIVGCRDATGNLLIIHCTSGRNNVVITDSYGFMTIGRPLYYGE